MSESSAVHSARPARPSAWLGRGLAYVAAAVLFAALALAPALLAIGVAGKTNPLGYLAAAAWCIAVGVVVWGFGSAAHRPPPSARSVKADTPAQTLRRARRFVRHHRHGIRRRVNRPALLAALGVAVVLTVAMVQAWA